ncbi:hypothetical protein [Enterobacter cancerogenus]|uniref:hypothetical protein n=1 Tax=Enterobacter cancerogenus TaxID=69218 RepID=UPI0028B79122|nr:hypothetical protein [Enterobacter cancerogenus]MDT7008627.1 hypothetical protein [Enterobacter cancerogenus]WNN58338.1 hypothetical protein RIN64_07885 [Enterobacter cancerogenus]
MNILLFLYGFFFALPLTALNLIPGGMKVDDLILFLILSLLPLMMYKRDRRIVVSVFYLLFFIITLIFAFISFYKGISNSDEFMGDSAFTVISRIIQSLLILTFLILIRSSAYTLQYFFKGFLIAATISLIIFFLYYISKINFATFVSRGVYFAKDIFQYNEDLPFTVHVNTLGSFFLIAFFIIKSNFPRYGLYSYAFLAPAFLLISKGDIFAILVYFGYIFYKKNNINALIIIIFFSLIVVLSPWLYEIYLSLSEYKVYTSGRNELYGAAVKSIISNPFGYGLGMQNNVLFSMTGIDFPAHNIFLSIGIEFGVFYLVFSILFIIFGMYACTLNNRVIFFSFLIIGMFGNAMYFYKFHSLAIGLCVFGLWHIPQTIYKNGNFT